jgi:hypothetical protein
MSTSSLAKQHFLSRRLPWNILPDFIRFFIYLDFTAVFFHKARSTVLRPTPNLEEQVSVFMSTSDKVVQSYPQAPGPLFAAFCDSQGYGGGIITRLHTEKIYIIH